MRCPIVERVFIIARRAILDCTLQPGVGEIGSQFVDAGKLVAVGENDGGVGLSRERVKRGVAETFMSDLEGVAQGEAVLLVGE